MHSQRNILFIVVDSLRADAIDTEDAPFLSSLQDRMAHFRRAYAAECWTLPSHMSMFTGLLPRQHGAHFGTMSYNSSSPTIAEVLRADGYATEAVTRNFVFDGQIPGVLRGFERITRPLSTVPDWSLAPLFLAAAKPRIRRHLRETGFFHQGHRESVEFVRTFARSLLPADERVLDHLIETMVSHRQQQQPFFLFANLYDVHAPYPPQVDSVLRPWSTWAGMNENLLVPYALAQLGAHRYLCDGFRLPGAVRQLLVDRYRCAVRLMDRKLETFFAEAETRGVLDDTLVVLTSDHGEAFGEHDLYLHDASVYETHLHVPLWIGSADGEGSVIDDIVNTRDLFELFRRFAKSGQDENTEDTEETILDESYRQRHPYAEADHFHYTKLRDAAPRYRLDQRTIITAAQKFVRRGESFATYNLDEDPAEKRAVPMRTSSVAEAARAAGAGAAVAGFSEAD